MSRKKNKIKREESVPRLKLETKHTILGLVCIALALFLFLARFGRAGVAGQAIYHSTDFLIGAGFLLVPLVILILGLSFFSASKPRVIPLRFGAGLILLLCGLGLLSLIKADWGGLVGLKLTAGLISYFDVYATGIFLFIVGLGSLLLIFDINFSLSWVWLKSLFARQPVLTDSTAMPLITSPLPAPATTDVATTNSNQSQAQVATELKKDKSERPLTARTKNYIPPPLNLLEADSGRPDVGDIRANSNIIKRTLANFGIVVEMDEVSIGPSITRYALKPAEGVKLARIVTLQNDLALALAAHPLRIEAPIPGRSLVGIEIPNTVKSTVGLGSLLSSPDYQNSGSPLLTALGKGISGQPQFSDLAKAPHFLIAGATGSGKSVVIHNFVLSLLYRNPPERLRLIMIDPKQVELTIYNKIPHLLTSVITDPKKAILSLRWAAKEMERRYNILETEAVRNIESYHKLEVREPMPYIVIIIDELAHIMSLYPREFEASIVRLAQMSRAVGIHLVLSTQRPSVEVITGLIKANIPCRIALQVASQVDSRTILDMAGAEKLLGAGDMLYLSADQSKPSRLQSAYVSEAEVKKVVKFLADQDIGGIEKLELEQLAAGSGNSSNPDLSENFEGDDDQLYEAARLEVKQAGKASASYLQRRLKIGYARAARLLDQLEERGVIGPGEGAKPREVYGQGQNDAYADEV